MKTPITLLSIFTALVALSQAQTPNLEWVFPVGNNYAGNADADQGNAICTDAHGNSYTTGYFSSSADFDQGPGTFTLNAIGSYDLFLMKSDVNGNFKWAKSFGSPSVDMGSALSYDDHGCIYLAGGFAGLIDFDDGPGTNLLTAGSQRDIFVQKIDTLGNVIWTKALTGTGATQNHANAIEVNYNKNAVYLTGSFESTVDFNPGAGTNFQTANGDADFFVQKFDLLGNAVWTRTFGNAGHASAYAITSDTAGNVYITGAYEGTLDIDPGLGTLELTSNGYHDIFMLKLTSAGDLVWANSIGGADDDLAESVQLDAGENVYITGSYAATTDFDPGAGISEMTAESATDAFILKLSNTGTYDWARTISNGEDADYGKSSVIDAEGYIYTTGTFNSTSDFDPSSGTAYLTSNGGRDFFIQKMDSHGNFVWAHNLGGYGMDEARSIALDPDKNICLTGVFRNTVDFDPWSGTSNLTCNEYGDAFALKLNQTITYAGLMPQETEGHKSMLYPNPASGNTTLLLADSQNASISLYDMTGKLVSTLNNTGTSPLVTLDLAELDAGTYLVCITTPQGTTTQKLTVQR